MGEVHALLFTDVVDSAKLLELAREAVALSAPASLDAR